MAAFVIVLFAIVVRRRLEDFNVAGRMLLGEVKHLLGLLGLLQLEISHGDHQLGVRAGLLRLGALQQVDALLRVAGAHLELAENKQIVGALGIGANDLIQQPLRLVVLAHAGVRLRQSALSIGVAGRHLQAMLIGVHRSLIAARQSGCVAEQEPELAVLGRRFHRTLRVVGSQTRIAATQGVFGGSRQAAYFNAAAPADAVVSGSIVLAGLLVLLLVVGRSRRTLGLLTINFERLRQRRNREK